MFILFFLTQDENLRFSTYQVFIVIFLYMITILGKFNLNFNIAQTSEASSRTSEASEEERQRPRGA